MAKVETNHDALTKENVNTGLGAEQRAGIVSGLNQLLADEFLLYTKTRNYHWNVVGPRFHDLHVFFEKQYDQLAELIDEIAENARQFGGVALGTLAEFAKESRLKEEPGVVPDADSMISNLLADHETIAQELRYEIKKADEEYEAQDAADFLTSVLEAHNKMAWMLRSFLTKKL